MASAFALYTLSLHDALPIWRRRPRGTRQADGGCAGSLGADHLCGALRQCRRRAPHRWRSEEHTSELQSLRHLVCRLLLEKKKKQNKNTSNGTLTHKHTHEKQ